MIAALLQRARRDLGVVGLASLVLLAAAVLFLQLVLKPLEERGQLLENRLASSEWLAAKPGAGRDRTPGAAAKLAAFYQFFETGDAATDWLARLNAIAAASGIQLRSADYRMHKTGTRIERYEVVLPLSGSYPQIRAFLRKVLAEIPVLSLDQVSIKKERAQNGAVQADVRVTLHLVRP